MYLLICYYLLIRLSFFSFVLFFSIIKNFAGECLVGVVCCCCCCPFLLYVFQNGARKYSIYYGYGSHTFLSQHTLTLIDFICLFSLKICCFWKKNNSFFHPNWMLCGVIWKLIWWLSNRIEMEKVLHERMAKTYLMLVQRRRHSYRQPLLCLYSKTPVPMRLVILTLKLL